jgi:hypothetical protein
MPACRLSGLVALYIIKRHAKLSELPQNLSIALSHGLLARLEFPSCPGTDFVMWMHFIQFLVSTWAKSIQTPGPAAIAEVWAVESPVFDFGAS